MKHCSAPATVQGIYTLHIGDINHFVRNQNKYMQVRMWSLKNMFMWHYISLLDRSISLMTMCQKKSLWWLQVNFFFYCYICFKRLIFHMSYHTKVCSITQFQPIYTWSFKNKNKNLSILDVLLSHQTHKQKKLISYWEIS